MPSKHICIIFTTKSNVVKEKKYIRVNGRNRICSTYISALSGVTGSSLWLADGLLPVLKHSSGFDGLSCHVWENTERLWCRRLVQRTGGNETWVMSVNGEWSCFFFSCCYCHYFCFRVDVGKWKGFHCVQTVWPLSGKWLTFNLI